MFLSGVRSVFDTFLRENGLLSIQVFPIPCIGFNVPVIHLFVTRLRLYRFRFRESHGTRRVCGHREDKDFVCSDQTYDPAAIKTV